MSLPSTTVIYGKLLPKTSSNVVSDKIPKVYGFKYPFQANPGRGYFSKETGLDLVRSNLRQLIRTIRGERFMLPDYGCNIRNYLMEPLDQTTFNEIKKDVFHAINKYFSKVSTQKLQIFETESGGLNVKLFCSLNDNEAVKFETDLNV
jgi:phage baseplate assembly protein W